MKPDAQIATDQELEEAWESASDFLGSLRAVYNLHRQDGARDAAALRAAADQVVPEQKPWHRTSDWEAAKHQVRQQFLGIAAELESM